MINKRISYPVMAVATTLLFPLFLFALIQVINRYSLGDKDASFGWSLVSLGVFFIGAGVLKRLSSSYKSVTAWLSVTSALYAIACFYRVTYLIAFSGIGIALLVYFLEKRTKCLEKPSIFKVMWPATAPVVAGLVVAALYYLVVQVPNRPDQLSIEEWLETGTREAPSYISYDELHEFARKQDVLYESTGDAESRERAFKAYEAAYEARVDALETGEDEYSDEIATELMVIVSNRYFNGDGVEQNYPDAHYFYSKLAWNNDTDIAAEYSKKLADMWANGIGVEKDIEMALQYYRFGDEPHYFEIAEMYRKSEDYRNASIHYSRIPDDPRASYWRAEISFRGLGRRDVDGRLDFDYNDAFRFMDFAARNGHKLAQAKLAEYYLLGIGVEKDPAQASYWINQASSNNDATGYVNYVLGLAYLAAPQNNDGYDSSKAIPLLESASDDGVIEATIKLGELYAFEPDSDAQLVTGRTTLLEQANAGNPRASYLVGLLFKNGQGFEQSYQEAFERIQYAASNGIPEAAWEMSDFYKHGYYVEQSQLRSDRWNAYWRANR
ncbi:tetratricopeptide repeat protein [Saccharospirillum alexandrii]|uniref:tetratricopeptide repeat protein n=1 Tax=Saccharospirillum alexandrii TaxID=2448477 RepID=UPI003734E663